MIGDSLSVLLSNVVLFDDWWLVMIGYDRLWLVMIGDWRWLVMIGDWWCLVLVCDDDDDGDDMKVINHITYISENA